MKTIFEYEREGGDNHDYLANGFRHMKHPYHEGFVVVQSPPQTRTILTSFRPRRLALPYLIQIVGYARKDKKFYYNGIFGQGLIVLFANKPIESLDSEVYICPLEGFREGLCCTPHQYDGQLFKTKEELVSFATGIWWGITHEELYYDSTEKSSQWLRTSQEDILDFDWRTRALTLEDAINRNYKKATSYGLLQPFQVTSKDFNDWLWFNEEINAPSEMCDEHPVDMPQHLNLQKA